MDKKNIKMDKYTTKEKLLISSLVSAMVSFIVFIFNPIDIFANNAQEFSFAFKDIVFPFLLCFLGSFAAIFGILMIFNRHLLNLITSTLISIFIAGYIYNIYMGKDTFVSGDVRIDFDKATTTYTIILGITIYVMFLIGLFLKKKWKNICAFLCIVLIAMNSATLISDFTTKDFVSNSGINVKYALSEKNMFNVSQKENIIYFLFDRFDKIFYDEVVQEYPDYFNESLDGFTFFDNTVSTFSRTYPATTGLITGVEYDGKTDAKEYFEKAYTTSPFLKDLKNNGYNINIYADRYYEYTDADIFKDLVSNATKIDGYTPNKKDILEYLLTLSNGRVFPHQMPAYIFNFTAQGTVLKLSSLDSDNEIYHDDDAKLYKKLKENGLDYYDSDKNFTFIYLHGTHSPYTLNANAERVRSSTSIEQTLGSFKIIKEYLNELKRLGVYDNSTIIITGDHGYPYTDYKNLLNEVSEGTRTCVFIKPKASKSQGLAVSHVQASVSDIIPTIVKDANLATKNNYGDSLFEINEDTVRTRIYYHSRINENSKLILDKYQITGDASNIKNWKLEESINTKQAWY